MNKHKFNDNISIKSKHKRLINSVIPPEPNNAFSSSVRLTINLPLILRSTELITLVVTDNTFLNLQCRPIGAIYRLKGATSRLLGD